MASGDSFILKGIPNDVFTSSVVNERRVKVDDLAARENWQEFKDLFLAEVTDIISGLRVLSIPRLEAHIARGVVFNGFAANIDFPIPSPPGVSEYDYLIEAPANKFLIVESVNPSLDFSGVNNEGNIEYAISVYIEGSLSNDWSYAGGTTTPAGTNLNTSLFPAQQSAESQLTQGGTATINSGVSDFTVFFATYFVNISGNREGLGGIEDSFFADGKKIIIAPGGSALFTTRLSGDAGGDMSVRANFTISELEVLSS